MNTETPRTILIVDDEPDDRMSMALLLRLLGHQVAVAADGRQALDYLHSHEAPSLIILDLRMPGMSGVQFRREQLRDPGLAHIPVIVVSGEASGNDALSDIAAFYPKASDPLILLELVERHCG